MRVDGAQLEKELSEERAALRAGLLGASATVGAADLERMRWVLSCDRAELWRQDGCRNMAQWLSGMAGISNWKARRWVAAAHALEELVHVSAALANGSLSLDKTVELTRFATPATEKKLISWARRVTVARVRERADEETTRPIEEIVDAHESRHLRWWWCLEGDRLGFEGQLPADQGAVWVEAIDRIARDLPEPPEAAARCSDSLLPRGPPYLALPWSSARLSSGACSTSSVRSRALRSPDRVEASGQPRDGLQLSPHSPARARLECVAGR